MSGAKTLYSFSFSPTLEMTRKVALIIVAVETKLYFCDKYFAMLSQPQLERYDTDGFLVLKGFVDDRDCDALRERAAEMVSAFDPAGVVSIFTTHEQSRIADEYFMTSGDKIRFFFEEKAFLSDGTLKQRKERSINKIGHALHDLDPMFNRFSQIGRASCRERV